MTGRLVTTILYLCLCVVAFTGGMSGTPHGLIAGTIALGFAVLALAVFRLAEAMRGRQ